MKLEALIAKYQLPVDVVHFCMINGLLDLHALEFHQAAYGTFLDLPAGSPAIEHRLLDLLTAERVCGEFSSIRSGGLEHVDHGRASEQSVAPEDSAQAQLEGPRVSDLGLDQLATLFGLSVRAFNVCENAELTSLDKIRAFAVEHGDFSKLRNCGVKTQMELVDLLARARTAGYVDGDDTPKGEERQQELVGLICTVHFQKLSIQAKEVVEQYAGGHSADALVGFFMWQGRLMPRLPGVHKSVMRELREMRRRIMVTFRNYRPGRTGTAAVPSAMERWALSHGIDFELMSLLDGPHDRPYLLRFVVLYLSGVWSGSRLSVYRTQLFGDGSMQSLEAIGSIAGMTRERVRQLLMKMDNDVVGCLAILGNLPDMTVHYPELFSEQRWLLVDAGSVAILNAREGTTCAPALVAYIASALNKQRLRPVKWTELFDRALITKELDHSHPLLVDVEWLGWLPGIVNAMVDVIGTRRSSPERIPIGKFVGADGATEFLQAVPFLARIIPLRYPEVRIEDGHLHLPANTKSNQEDPLEEVLQRLDEPSHLNDIQALWHELFPERPITAAGRRSVVVRNKERFLSIGRTSTYGLRTWEAERNGLKGGTIRGIIDDLLDGSEQPLHLEDVVEEVRRFRPDTYLNSVRLNLQLDTSGRFMFFPGGYLGLSSKVYQAIPAPPAPVPGSLMRASVLERFRGEHRDALAAYLKAHCSATEKRIGRVIDNAISEGRLLVDERGVIRGIDQGGPDGEQHGGELPFEW